MNNFVEPLYNSPMHLPVRCAIVGLVWWLSFVYFLSCFHEVLLFVVNTTANLVLPAHCFNLFFLLFCVLGLVVRGQPTKKVFMDIAGEGVEPSDVFLLAFTADQEGNVLNACENLDVRGHQVQRPSPQLRTICASWVAGSERTCKSKVVCRKADEEAGGTCERLQPLCSQQRRAEGDPGSPRGRHQNLPAAYQTQRHEVMYFRTLLPGVFVFFIICLMFLV